MVDLASTRARRATMSKVAFALVVSALAMMPTAASAIFYTGNELLERCEEATETVASALCLGFVMGVSDAIEAYQDLAGVPKLICVPTAATSGELMEIVTKYLRDNPKVRSPRPRRTFGWPSPKPIRARSERRTLEGVNWQSAVEPEKPRTRKP